MAATADMHSDALPEGDDELRSLIGVILSGDADEEIYLSDVASICRKPETARALRALVDRYHRSGRMPPGQHRRIQAKIEQTVAAYRGQHAPAARGDGNLFEDLTCDLSAEPLIVSEPQAFVRGEDLVDPNPTLESPVTPVPRLVPRAAPPARSPAAITARLAAIASAAPAAPAPELMPASAAATATATTSATAAEPQASIAVGHVLHDRYELQLLLGRGGMASVYKALDRDRVALGLADCFVAVKVVPANSPRQTSRAALAQEYQSAQRLSHPNVVNVFDIADDRDATFYSMELLSGARLSQVLRRIDGAVLQRRFALAIIRDIGAAVAHAHSRGVVHGDLKPSNVMITLDGEVRVVDFGGVSMPTREPWVSEGDADEAYHAATPAYASCEQLERRRADPRDDVYALACIAYLLLAGRHPFDQLSSLVARSRGMRARRPARMPLAQWRVLSRGLAWGREQQTMAIETWLAKLRLHGAARTLPPLAELTAAVAPRHSWQRSAALAVSLLAAAVGLWALQSQTDIHWTQRLSAAWNAAQGRLREAWPAPQPRTSPSPGAVAPDHSARPLLAAPALATPPPALVAAPALALPVPAGADNKVLASGAGAAGASAAGLSSNTAPHVAFAAQSYAVSAGDPAARIVIQRVGDLQGELSFVWWTEAASAEPDVDYASFGLRTEHMASGQDKLTVYVPIISNPLRTWSTQFHVALSAVGGHRAEGSAPSPRATVTIERGGQT